ncbi:hypothetical protein EYF80_040636 [Liparis tanakae]|uniref:Uncharacterized protein n=1 Tax=Liparis tanakae TaxID=230148 RepID=A0A4Z2G886_9TELE|nr:hypothetical protein EYF80_040636 [Liparis tanakae]
MLGLLFLKVFTAWKTSTTLCLLAISHTMLLAQNTPLRPPPFLRTDNYNNMRHNARCHMQYAVLAPRRAVHDGPPLPLLSLTLPLVNLHDQLEEGAFGGGDFSVSRPPQSQNMGNVLQRRGRYRSGGGQRS